MQVAPTFASNGRLTGVSPKKVSAKHPRSPIAGAVTLKLNITIPDQAFTPIKVDIDVPMEALESSAVVEVETADEHAVG